MVLAVCFQLSQKISENNQHDDQEGEMNNC